MSEMATRLSDGQEVKIGTCESMYYCRWDQRKKVRYPYMTTGLHWRLPLPKEDGIKPGDFESHRILEYREDLRTSFIPCDAMLNHDVLSAEDKEHLAKSVGIVQTRVEMLGMLVNVPCYHGLKLPESVEGGAKFFWNGKRDALYFDGVWNKEKELLVGMACAACGESWSMPYQEAEPLFHSLWMKVRLLHECSDYWWEKNDEPCPYVAHSKAADDRELTIGTYAGGSYYVKADGQEVYAGEWEGARNNFINLLPDESNRKEDERDPWRHEEWNLLCWQGEELKQRYLKEG